MSVTVIVRSRARHANSLVHGRVETALKKAAFDIEGQAKMRAPVDTGHLKNSINADGGDLEWRVSSPANYSVYQEFGTRFMAAHPYLIPALRFVKPSLLAALRRLA